MKAINISNRTAALTAGISIVIMAVVAGFVVGFVQNNLIIPGDAQTTAENIKASESLFRMGILGWIMILITDILAAWGLYEFFKPVNDGLSRITGWLRMVYAAILGVAINWQLMILLNINGADYLSIWQTSQSNAQILFYFNAFLETWSFGLIIFGGHLLGLGYLALKSGFIPKIWGILLLLAAVGYVVIHLGNVLIADFHEYQSTLEAIFMAPMVLGEVGFGVWLIIKGGRRNKRLVNGPNLKIKN